PRRVAGGARFEGARPRPGPVGPGTPGGREGRRYARVLARVEDERRLPDGAHADAARAHVPRGGGVPVVAGRRVEGVLAADGRRRVDVGGADVSVEARWQARRRGGARAGRGARARRRAAGRGRAARARRGAAARGRAARARRGAAARGRAARARRGAAGGGRARGGAAGRGGRGGRGGRRGRGGRDATGHRRVEAAAGRIAGVGGAGICVVAADRGVGAAGGGGACVRRA